MKAQCKTVAIRMPDIVPGKKMCIKVREKSMFVPMKSQAFTHVNKGRDKAFYEERKRNNEDLHIVGRHESNSCVPQQLTSAPTST